MTEPVLAIDFGTFASSARFVTGGKIGDYVPDPGSPQEERSWRSVVYWDGARLHAGEAAWEQRTTEPHRYRAEFKPLLRERRPIVLGGSDGRHFLPEDLVKRILTAIREAANHKNAAEVKRAVITIPPSYLEPGDHRAELMLETADLAGFSERVELIAEPVAAAWADPAGGHFNDGAQVLVYDFGGGTFDAAIVRIGADGTRVPARSIDDCGGMRVDAAIQQWLCEHGPSGIAALLERDTSGDDGLRAARDLIRLREFCEGLKLSLSEPDRNEPVRRFFDPLGLEVTMKVEDLDACAADSIDQTISCCRELLRDANVAPADLGAILLVGGSSRLRGVRERLAGAFGVRDIRAALRPTLAVVDGAARFAAQAGTRRAPRTAEDPRMRAVRWDLPGDSARVVRWNVGVGDAYDKDQELAELRLRTGEIYRLVDDVGGTVRTVHAGENQTVRGGDWLLTSWRPPAEGWQRPIKASNVPVAVSDWTVFAGTKAGALLALAAATGESRWECAVGAEITTPPMLRHGRVSVGCIDGSVHVIDEQSGALIGAQPLRVEGAVTSVPLLGGGRTWVATDSGWLYGVAPDGTRKAFSCARGVRPVLADGVICVRGQDGVLYGVDPVAASVVPDWSHRLDAGRGQHGALGAAVYEYFGDSGIRKLSALTGEVEAEHVVQPEARPEPPAGGRLGRPSTATVLRLGNQVKGVGNQFKGIVRAGSETLWKTAPVCVAEPDGRATVYAGTADGRLIAFDADTLTPRDSAPIPESHSLRSLSYAHETGTLYAGAADKRLYLIGTRPGLQVRTFYEAGGSVTADPAVGFGAVFVPTGDGVLRAFPAAGEGTVR